MRGFFSFVTTGDFYFPFFEETSQLLNAFFKIPHMPYAEEYAHLFKIFPALQLHEDRNYCSFIKLH